MIKRYLTFEEEFSYFSSKFELQYILDGIETWLDFQKIRKDIFLFMKSVNEHHDGPPIQRDTSKDLLLDQILEFDFQYSIYTEINFAFAKLNNQEKADFYKTFVQNVKSNFFSQYDLVVKLASFSNNFIFADGILAKYNNLKQGYLDKLQNEIANRKKEIKDFSKFYSSLVYSDWSDSWLVGNGEASRRKTMFVLATLLKDGLISSEYFFELIHKYHGGKKYYKYVLSVI